MQLVDTNTNTAVGSAQSIQWAFNVNGSPSFTVQAPTTFPAIPNKGLYLSNAATYGTASCNGFQTDNQNGQWLNNDLTAFSSNNDPWSIFTYDGNRVFKEIGDRFDGQTGANWQANHAYSQGDVIVTGGYTQVIKVAGTSGNTPPDL